jgi:hypothetical protein
MRHYVLPLAILGLLLQLEAMSQNVGIGTVAPTRAKLEVIGIVGSGSTNSLFGSGNTGISFQRNWPTIGFNQYRDDVAPGSQGKYIANGFAAIQYFDPAGGYYAFDMFGSGTANSFTPGGVRAITVNPNGNTCIRCGVTNASLQVVRGEGVDGTAVFTGPTHWSHFNYNGNNNEDTYIRAGMDNGTVYINQIPNTSVLLGSTSTHLGINSSNPFYTIEVYQPSGQKAFTLVDAYNNRWGMAVNWWNTINNGSGMMLDLYYNNTGRTRFQYWDGACVVLSDERVKKDIEPMEPLLAKIGKLRPVRYEMIRNNPKHQQSIGFIAQEVEEMFPLMVRKVVAHEKDKPDVKDARVMDHTGFGVLAIKALQEQEQQILQLEKEKRELLYRLEKLEQVLN